MEPVEIARMATDAAAPLSGLRAVASLRRLADMLESQQVENALRAGHGWVEIATALGVSRQAVHKKYAKRFTRNLEGQLP